MQKTFVADDISCAFLPLFKVSGDGCLTKIEFCDLPGVFAADFGGETWQTKYNWSEMKKDTLQLLPTFIHYAVISIPLVFLIPTLQCHKFVFMDLFL